MRHIRIYHQGQLSAGTTIQLTTSASHHLSHVLRLKPGDFIRVFNGSDNEYTASIDSIQKNAVIVSINDCITTQTQSPLNIYLAQAICKPAKMDIIMQKATELGVNTITPIISEHTSIKLRAQQLQKKQQHWQEIIINACEQCGRNVLPILHPPQKINAWLTSVTTKTKLILTPGSQTKLRELEIKDDISLIIGPEGGFSDDEIATATEQQFQPISLGPRVLRAETAAIASLAILQALAGDG